MSNLKQKLKSVPGVLPTVRAVRPRVASVLNRARRLAAPIQLRDAKKLHLGAGGRQMAGWANVDIDGRNIIWDLTKPLPVRRGSVDFVYSEHFIEHISKDEGLRLLSNLREVLADEGVLRISTPDLAAAARNYISGNLVTVPDYDWEPQSLCEMLNDMMRAWGHQFVYDESELVASLKFAGFSHVKRVRWLESEHRELCNLESRPDMNDLIVEATP